MSRTAKQEKDTVEAIKQLKKMLRPGSRVYCVLRNVSRSGMSRDISLMVGTGKNVSDITWLAARALSEKINRDNGGIRMGGCGMDMGFALVYNLAHVLYGKGYNCAGERCPSADHSNGLREECKTCNGTGRPVNPVVLAMDSDICIECHGHGDIRKSFPRGKGVRHVDGYALKHEWL